MKAEEIGAEVGYFDIVTAAQSFHWTDQKTVAADLRTRLNEGGAFVHVAATTNRGVTTDDDLGRPQPPHDDIERLVASYLGPVRRAGRSSLPHGTKSGEDDVLRECGFAGPQTIDVGGGEVVERNVDDVVAAVFSLSSSAPHLFDDRLADFESELRALLRAAGDNGRFREKTREIRVSIWR